MYRHVSRIILSGLVFAAALAAGCGDGGNQSGNDVFDAIEDGVEPADVVSDDGTPDIPGDTWRDAAEDVPVNPDGVEQPAPEGRILVALWGWGGEYSSDAGIWIDFFDGPMRMDAFSAYTPGLYQVAARQGDCVLYTGSDAACDPACDWDKYCAPGNTCLSAPSRISAGRVTLTVGTATVTADPSTDEFMPCTYYADPVAAGQVALASTVKVEAAGAEGGFGAFSFSSTGVDPIEFGVDEANNSLVLEDGHDNEITWTTDPANATGAYVELLVNVGWHGSPPEAVLYCRKDAAAGSLVIPRAVVEAVPQIGGPSLMPHGSHIGLARTVLADVGGKSFEFTVARRHGLNPLHNAPEM